MVVLMIARGGEGGDHFPRPHFPGTRNLQRWRDNGGGWMEDKEKGEGEEEESWMDGQVPLST